MTILKQTLRLEHRLSDGDVLTSEVEFDFEESDNYVEAAAEARQLLVNTISNGRPGIIDKCRHAMGIRYSQQEFNDDDKRYKQLCLDIDKIKFDIAVREKNLKFLFYAKDRLAALTQMIKTAEMYQEFCNLLEASIKIQGSEDLEEEKKKYPHLQLPLAYSSEEEVEDSLNGEEMGFKKAF